MNCLRVCLTVATMLTCICTAKFAAAQSATQTAVIELNDGSQFDGVMLGLSSDTASFTIAGEAKSFPVDSISQIRFSDQLESSSEFTKRVTFVDGSALICTSVILKDRQLQAKTESGIEFKANSRLLDYVRFSSEPGESLEMWRETANEARESDALIVLKDQKLQAIEGIIGDVSADSVSFTVGERNADVKRSRLSGMLFYRRVTDEFAPPLCTLDLIDGSSIQVRSIDINEKEIKVNSAAGISFSLTADAIVTIDFGSNRHVWLSDLEPATNDWTPLLASPAILDSLKQFSVARIDKSFTGKPLSILMSDEDSGSVSSKEFSKGFSIKGGGKISFLLSNQYLRLTGSTGFDPNANAAGKVKLIVQIDGKNRIEEVLDAANMERPFEFDIDLSGADRIVFQVDYFDRRAVGDILHAVDMKLHR